MTAWLLFWSRLAIIYSLLICVPNYCCIGYQPQRHAKTTTKSGFRDQAIHANRRRKFILSMPLKLFTTGSLISGIALSSPSEASAVTLFDKKERRQLELCIVAMLRLQYWAMTVATRLQNEETEEGRKKAYLEARLGAKVAVTGKIGGGATGSVYTLGSLQIKDCLEDLQYYGKSRKVNDLRDDLVESLASIVEFDGLETTQDPSPRSSLTLAMYDTKKSIYVSRMLSERVIPLTEELVASFGREVRNQCNEYVVQYYPNELPPVPKQQDSTDVPDSSAKEV